MVVAKAQQAVQQSLDGVTKDSNTGIAGMVFTAVDRCGDPICAVPSGKKGISRNEPMTMDTASAIAMP